jgi:23S rRNA (uracil1939-C5)-methyltransferase
MRNKKDKPLPILEKVRIVDYAAEGKSLARIDGMVVFVDQAVPDDVVDLQVTYKKKSYMEAVPIHYHSYSPKRAETFCEHFGVCGGCKWQNLAYSEQLAYKQQQVIDALERIGKVALPTCNAILGSEQTTFYRNKLEYTFSNKKWLTEKPSRENSNEREEIHIEDSESDENIENKQENSNLSPHFVKQDMNALGFHVPKRFDKVLEINNCYLQPEPSNSIRLALKKFADENKLSFFDIKKREGFLRTLMIRTSLTGDVMVLVSFYDNHKENIEAVMQFLKDSFPQITSLLYVHNPKGNDTLQDLEIMTFHGKSYLTETMEGLQFRIGAKSFFQTNSLQAYELYKVTRDLAQLTGEEIVYDLYTGTGTIANFVAKNAKKVIGLEYVEQAIEDAKVNSQINNITNTEFYAGDMKDLLDDKFMQNHPKPDIIITDPPRAGMHENVVKMLLKIEAKKIVYVSCNPATQARDLALLDEKYAVTVVQPVDMFPHTHHVENVVLLERKCN